MRKVKRINQRAKYTLAFKAESVRLVKGGKSVAATAKVLGSPRIRFLGSKISNAAPCLLSQKLDFIGFFTKATI